MADDLSNLGRELRQALWSDEPAAARIRLSGVEIRWLPEPTEPPREEKIPLAIARYRKG